MGDTAICIVLIVPACHSVAGFLDILDAQVSILRKGNNPFTHGFVVKMPKGILPVKVFFRAGQDSRVRQPADNLHGGCVIELGGCRQQQGVGTNHFPVHDVLQQRHAGMYLESIFFAQEKLHLFCAFAASFPIQPFVQYFLPCHIEAVTVLIIVADENEFKACRLRSCSYIQPEIVNPDFLARLDVLEGVYDKAFEKIECFYDIGFAGGIGTQNKCTFKKGDSRVQNGHQYIIRQRGIFSQRGCHHGQCILFFERKVILD